MLKYIRNIINHSNSSNGYGFFFVFFPVPFSALSLLCQYNMRNIHNKYIEIWSEHTHNKNPLFVWDYFAYDISTLHFSMPNGFSLNKNIIIILAISIYLRVHAHLSLSLYPCSMFMFQLIIMQQGQFSNRFKSEKYGKTTEKVAHTQTNNKWLFEFETWSKTKEINTQQQQQQHSPKICKMIINYNFTNCHQLCTILSLFFTVFQNPQGTD